MKKHDNPVLSAAPRRVEHVDPEFENQIAKVEMSEGQSESGGEKANETRKEKGGISTVSNRETQEFKFKADPWENWEDDTAIFNSKVAATVNGAPILNGEVLDRYSSLLISLREDMQKKRRPPEEFNQQREMLVMRDLPGHIQRKLLVERMKSSMKPDQIKQINSHIDTMFEEEIKKLKRELKVSSRTELELELNKKGTTLQNVRDTFANEHMAGGYLHSKLEKPKHIERADIIAYYQAHPSEFAIPSKVEWDQIQVSFGSDRTKEEARKRIAKALAELQDGIAFSEVATKYSDGPTAKAGGRWEPMAEGSLVDTKLEGMLFDMPIGKLSDVFEGKSEFQIVRVDSRTEASKIPVGDVQDDIRKKLNDEQTKNRPKIFLEKLMSEAVIETKYDIMPPGSPKQ